MDENIAIQCFIAADYSITISKADIFWIINGSVYGLLQVPGDFIACSQSCDLTSLIMTIIEITITSTMILPRPAENIPKKTSSDYIL